MRPAFVSSAFVPARGLTNGHFQTIAGALFPGASCGDFAGTVQRRVKVSQGDYVVLHDDQPDVWKRGGHVVLLLHGLAGSHTSGYMMRIARRLNERGIRTFRMDHRGCGAARGLALHPYHAGRIDDLHQAVKAVERLCPGAAVSVVGFSLSGSLLLRYLGDGQVEHPRSLFRAVAVCPPLDLRYCVQRLEQTRTGQRYDWYFVRQLLEQISGSMQWRDDVPLARMKRLPRRLYDFDDLYTAPASGFESADHYYDFASAAPHMHRIRIPVTVLAAADDPLVSVDPICRIRPSESVSLCLTEHGGHLGYIARPGQDADRRWMDWRVMEWLPH